MQCLPVDLIERSQVSLLGRACSLVGNVLSRTTEQLNVDYSMPRKRTKAMVRRPPDSDCDPRTHIVSAIDTYVIIDSSLRTASSQQTTGTRVMQT